MWLKKATKGAKKNTSKGQGKSKGIQSTTIEYSDALMLVDVDSYWKELDELLTTLKRSLAQNLAVR